MKRGHRPVRTCLGCGAKDEKGGLVRVVASPGGSLRLDPVGVGRGGYLHRRADCWEAFLRKKKLYRAFRREIAREAREKLIRDLRESYPGVKPWLRAGSIR